MLSGIDRISELKWANLEEEFYRFSVLFSIKSRCSRPKTYSVRIGSCVPCAWQQVCSSISVFTPILQSRRCRALFFPAEFQNACFSLWKKGPHLLRTTAGSII